MLCPLAAQGLISAFNDLPLAHVKGQGNAPDEDGLTAGDRPMDVEKRLEELQVTSHQGSSIYHHPLMRKVHWTG